MISSCMFANARALASLVLLPQPAHVRLPVYALRPFFAITVAWA
jgi:hypothetical protein